MELPRGATPVDFAYAVHTDVGNTCVAAKIDRRLAPLSSTLFNGQTVEVITAPGARPNPSWLNFVVTGKARANIRNYLKNLRRGNDKTMYYDGLGMAFQLTQFDVTGLELSEGASFTGYFPRSVVAMIP